MSAPEYIRQLDDAARDAMIEQSSVAFAVDVEPTRHWIEGAVAAGADLRAVRLEGALAGALILIPMGQWFGGRPVPMVGVAGVSVALGQRRRGVASTMLAGALAEAHERGFALSALYASNPPLYRRVGFAAAGSCFEGKIDPAAVDVPGNAGRVRAASKADHHAVAKLYSEVAAEHPGFLDRGAYIWPRLIDVRAGVPAHGLLLLAGDAEPDASEAEAGDMERRKGATASVARRLGGEPGEFTSPGEGGWNSPPEGSRALGHEGDQVALDGYVFFRLRQAGNWQELIITDAIARHADGWRRIWAAVRDVSTMVRGIGLRSAPADPLYLALRHARVRLTLHENWMLRVVDVRAALEARGYAPALRGALTLAVRDDVLAANDATFRLEVADGRGSCARLDDGSAPAAQQRAATLDVRGLAGLYSGFCSPAVLRQRGWLSGPRDDDALLAALFAGPAPWMREMF